MTWSGLAIQAAYFTVLSLLALYGLHRFSLVWICARSRPIPGPVLRGPASSGGQDLPRVTVQLPIYNEYYVVARLVEAACALDYPRDRLEIQVLDDSTDGTSALVRRLAASYRSSGHDIHHLRRPHRKGYKAGALEHGLKAARGELIAVFDADFVPPPDFLRRAVQAFTDPVGGPRLGLVQARWGHANRDYSILTRAQALLLDGHFAVEHSARQAAGRFLNFNGTAGIFRRRCIEEAGGWRDDTLTEDLDISYRAQLAGWRFAYLHDLVVPAELPVELNALRAQQSRWAQGSIQTAVKLLGRVLAADLPRAVKLEAAVHLTNNVAYLLLACLAVLIVPALAARGPRTWSYLAADLPLFLAGTGSFALFCGVAQRAVRSDWVKGMASLPAMMAIGIGLSLNNGLAVAQAMLGRVSEFQRTPKFGLGASRDVGWRKLAYRGPRSTLAVAEAAFALYFVAAIAAAARAGRYASLPFLLLFAGGFLYITGLSAAQSLSRRITAASARPAEAPAP